MDIFWSNTFGAMSTDQKVTFNFEYKIIIVFCYCFSIQWHALDRQEQAKYYEMARKERALHMQLYPGWSARDNYAQQGKKKKRKRDKSQGKPIK